MTEDEATGLLIQSDTPATPEKFIEKAVSLGMVVQKASRFGFRPEIDRSGAVPNAEPGAPVVDAARDLRRRRRGEKPLNGAALKGRAKELLDEAELARKRNGSH
jgi:hypothetical protein